MRYCLDLPNWLQIVGNTIDHWQTMIAGMIAIVAALIGTYAIGRQARKDLARRHNAARAVLPLALSEIGGFCQKIADNIASEIEVRGNNPGTDWAAELAPKGSSKHLADQNFPESTIPAFQNFIESVTDAANIRHSAELISSLQILNSRYKELNLYRAGVVIYLYDILIYTAKVVLLNDTIFNYGRFVDENKFSVVGETSNSDAWDMINKKAHGLIFSRKFPDLFFGEINARIERYKANDSSPWNEKFEQ